MSTRSKHLVLDFDGSEQNRDVFLKQIRTKIMCFTAERMRLDALIHEIAKNVFDHAGGKGKLVITQENDFFHFTIYDYGPEARPRTEVNFGIGKSIIEDLAKAFDIELHVETTAGIRYSGTYIRR